MEYLGNRGELKLQDEEIDEVKFFCKEDLMRILYHEETHEFLNKAFNEIV